MQRMADFGPAADDEAPSYFECGRVPADAIEALFSAAELLYRIAPWTSANDSQVLRLDIL